MVIFWSVKKYWFCQRFLTLWIQAIDIYVVGSNEFGVTHLGRICILLMYIANWAFTPSKPNTHHIGAKYIEHHSVEAGQSLSKLLLHLSSCIHVDVYFRLKYLPLQSTNMSQRFAVLENRRRVKETSLKIDFCHE